MAVYGKAGIRELAEQNLAKARYLGDGLDHRFTGPSFNEFVVRCGQPEALNETLLEEKVIGGIPLGRYYPELADCMLLCATEMTPRAAMDTLKRVYAAQAQPALVATQG
jgi:glycine dehydrogenase subunit 1